MGAGDNAMYNAQCAMQVMFYLLVFPVYSIPTHHILPLVVEGAVALRRCHGARGVLPRPGVAGKGSERELPICHVLLAPPADIPTYVDTAERCSMQQQLRQSEMA
jgi:hypothetical protein